MNNNKIRLYEMTAECRLANKFGVWRLRVYKNKITNEEHIVLIALNADFNKPLTIRIHSSCVTGEIFYAKDCDCRKQLDIAFKIIAREKGGIFYLFQEGRGIGLTNKIKAYALKERGYNTVEANLALGLPAENRKYDMVGEILADLGVKEINLVTNNPFKVKDIRELGIKIKKIIPDETKPNKFNNLYLEYKKNSMGHKLRKVK